MAPKHEAAHDTVDAIADINLNYERLQQSRADGSSAELQQTFEQRMNRALDRYSDLARFMAQAVLLEPSDNR